MYMLMRSSRPPFSLDLSRHQMPMSLLVLAFLIIALILPLSMHFSRNAATSAPPQEPPLLPGLTIEKDPTPNAGLVVTSVQSEGSDQRSSIAVGDHITRINGRPVFTVGQARSYLNRRRHGHPIWLEVSHGLVRHIVQIT